MEAKEYLEKPVYVDKIEHLKRFPRAVTTSTRKATSTTKKTNNKSATTAKKVTTKSNSPTKKLIATTKSKTTKFPFCKQCGTIIPYMLPSNYGKPNSTNSEIFYPLEPLNLSSEDFQYSNPDLPSNYFNDHLEDGGVTIYETLLGEVPYSPYAESIPSSSTTQRSISRTTKRSNGSVKRRNYWNWLLRQQMLYYNTYFFGPRNYGRDWWRMW